MQDRRAARRYDLSLPVIVRASDAAFWNGRTSNLSTHGVYFTSNVWLGIGGRRNLTMILPAECTGGDEVLVQAVSRIVRVERRSTNSETIGVAAEIERFEIVRQSEQNR